MAEASRVLCSFTRVTWLFRNLETREIALELFGKTCSEDNAQTPTHSACTDKLENREYFRRECRNFEEVHFVENYSFKDSPEESTLLLATKLITDLENDYVDPDEENDNLPQLMDPETWLRMLLTNE